MKPCLQAVSYRQTTVKAAIAASKVIVHVRIAKTGVNPVKAAVIAAVTLVKTAGIAINAEQTRAPYAEIIVISVVIRICAVHVTAVRSADITATRCARSAVMILYSFPVHQEIFYISNLRRYLLPEAK